MRRSLALTLLLVATAAGTGCSFEKQPLEAGESYRVDLACRGTTERFLAIDVQPDFGSPLGGSVGLSDRTTSDDAIGGARRIRIEGLRPADARTRQRVEPTRGHYEWKELTARGEVRLVLEYKGHADTYHLTFPPGGGCRVEPDTGEFSRIFVSR